tara:strand:+ start:189 stop:377 length:189 start_codon:yes stop_codon:yes gene_type:complete
MIYKFSNKKYKIIKSKFKDELPFNRPKQILADFFHCESIGDYGTIKNRITNGLKWGWLKEVK